MQPLIGVSKFAADPDLGTVALLQQAILDGHVQNVLRILRPNLERKPGPHPLEARKFWMQMKVVHRELGLEEHGFEDTSPECYTMAGLYKLNSAVGP